jgi:two-component system NtrC family sensor kinase
LNQAPPAFDRQVELAEMLRAVPRAALDKAMEHSIGGAWRIAGGDGLALREGALALEGTLCSVTLAVDLEPVGTLAAPAGRQDWLAPAAKWIELLLGASNRYRMAADLHLQAVHADHAELMAKHAALAASEERYRSLNEQLEVRVREQVGIIEQSQRRVVQAEKMASIGNLAAGMAHEINNPIGFMRSNLSTARQYVSTLKQDIGAQSWPPAKAAQLAYLLDDFGNLVEESIVGADRVAGIVADLKAYASSGAARLVLADPNDALRSALRMLGELPPGVYLEQELHPLPNFTCDIAGLNRVVLALLLNARTAMGGRSGAIRIASAVRGGELLISVEDEGCGIGAAALGRIFDPFFTTADVGGGMGLGLTVASDVVRAHGGKITVQSAPGKGSTFVVCIPFQAGGAEERQQ